MAIELWRAHRLLIGLAGAYVIVGGIVLHVLGRPWPIRLVHPALTAWWLAASVGYVAAILIRDRCWPRSFGRHAAGAGLVLLLALPVQITFQSLKQAIGPIVGFPWDTTFARWDDMLHGGPAYRIAHALPVAALQALDLIYMTWFPFALGALTWWGWSRARAWRARSLLAWLLLWIVGATLGAWSFASAGPPYVEHLYQDTSFRPLFERLDDLGIFLARINQTGLWDARQTDVWLHFGGISAMPSMHVALAVLVALSVWARFRGAGIACWLYAVAIQIGSVSTGWHYAIDGYAGALIAWGCWRVAGWPTPAGATQVHLDSYPVMP